VSVHALANDNEGAQPIQQGSVTYTGDHAVVAYDGAGTFTYSPPDGFSGVYSFNYTECDNSNGPNGPLCSSATVAITVGAPCPPEAPSATSVSTREGMPVSGSALWTACYFPLVPATLNTTSQPNYGTLVLNTTTGAYTYTPNPNFYGNDSLTIQECDSAQLCSSVTIAVIVTPVGPQAIAVNAQAIENGAAINIPVLSSDIAGPAGLTTVRIAAAPDASQGTATVLTNNQIAFTPARNFDGVSTFSYSVCDSSVTNNAPSGTKPAPLCSTALVQVTITTTNPTALSDTASVYEDSSTTIAVLSNVHAGSAPINASTVTITQQGQHGTAIANTDGTVTFTPTAGYYGNDTVTFEVCDQSHPTPLCSTAEIFITIQGVPPTAHDASIQYAYGQSATLSINVTAGAQPVQFSSVTLLSAPVAGATATVNITDGSITYTPAPGPTYSDSLLFQVCDNSKPQPLCSTAHATFIEQNIVTSWVLRYRLVTINYNILGQAISATIQTETPAGTQVGNVASGPASIPRRAFPPS
jgi:hypothetical protein